MVVTVQVLGGIHCGHPGVLGHPCNFNVELTGTVWNLDPLQFQFKAKIYSGTHLNSSLGPHWFLTPL